ncbi:MAG: hypothetical protein ACK5K7_04250 [Bacilli bacterium]
MKEEAKVLPSEFIMLHYISTKKFGSLKFFEELYGNTVWDTIIKLINMNYIYNSTKVFIEEHFNKLKNIGELAEKEIQDIFNNCEYNLTIIGKRILTDHDSIKRTTLKY